MSIKSSCTESKSKSTEGMNEGMNEGKYKDKVGKVRVNKELKKLVKV